MPASRPSSFEVPDTHGRNQLIPNVCNPKPPISPLDVAEPASSHGSPLKSWDHAYKLQSKKVMLQSIIMLVCALIDSLHWIASDSKPPTVREFYAGLKFEWVATPSRAEEGKWSNTSEPFVHETSAMPAVAGTTRTDTPLLDEIARDLENKSGFDLLIEFFQRLFDVPSGDENGVCVAEWLAVPNQMQACRVSDGRDLFVKHVR